jgi:hypothetical protein
MTKPEKQFSGVVQCAHCANSAPMEIVSTYSKVVSHLDNAFTDKQFEYDAGDVFELLLCPACKDVTLRQYFWHEYADDEDISMRVLYPVANRSPLGLPEKIKSSYEAAVKVKTIDANAYGVLVGRVLEMVCDDRKATGNQLGEKLADLATKQEFPEKLVGVTNGLRNLRNIGAHATLGELTKMEVPILEDLCKAILEYVYSAPFLAQQAENSLARLKKRSKRT